jgi:hypothetical protein
MKFLILAFGLSSLILSSCTINITIADTHGYANDLVDETAKTDASAEVEVPVKTI